MLDRNPVLEDMPVAPTAPIVDGVTASEELTVLGEGVHTGRSGSGDPLRGEELGECAPIRIRGLGALIEGDIPTETDEPVDTGFQEGFA